MVSASYPSLGKYLVGVLAEQRCALDVGCERART